MRIAVTGANGQVGFELVRSLMPLGDVIALDRSRCRLDDPASLSGVVGPLRADVVVNAAAYTAVDRAEGEEVLATRVNGEAPGELARIARETGALLIHYSTDYVFDGRKRGAWSEDDPVAPLNAYGRSKLAGERAIAASECDHVILRTSWVFAARGGNFMNTMLRLGAEREALSVVGDQIGAPTWARNIADATAHVVARAQAERSTKRFRSAILHLASQGEASWHGFAEAIFAEAKIYLPERILRVAELDAIPTSAYPTPAARPINSVLDCTRLATRYGIRLPHWRQALVRCLEELKVQDPGRRDSSA